MTSKKSNDTNGFGTSHTIPFKDAEEAWFWKEVSRQLLAFGQRNLPADVLTNLSSSYEGVLALYKMMQSDEPGLKRQTENPSAVGEQDLQSMMRDPKYWRDKDPAFVAKVTEGFKSVYGE